MANTNTDISHRGTSALGRFGLLIRPSDPRERKASEAGQAMKAVDVWPSEGRERPRERRRQAARQRRDRLPGGPSEPRGTRPPMRWARRVVTFATTAWRHARRRREVVKAH
jgi:hypothetical protein